MAEGIITNIGNWNAKERLVSIKAAMQYSGAAVEALLAEITGGFYCIPMEGTPGKSVQFTNAYDGKGYSMCYHVTESDEFVGYAYVHVDGIARDPAYDQPSLRNTQRQYRITFTGDAAKVVDAFELAWLLSKYELDVKAKNERPMLFVRGSYGDVQAFVEAARFEFGNVIEAVELPRVLCFSDFNNFVNVMDA